MNFDVNTVRVLVTVAGLLLFLLLVLHSYSRQRRPEHDDAAMLPFAGEAAPGQAFQADARQGDAS